MFTAWLAEGILSATLIAEPTVELRSDGETCQAELETLPGKFAEMLEAEGGVTGHEQVHVLVTVEKRAQHLEATLGLRASGLGEPPRELRGGSCTQIVDQLTSVLVGLLGELDEQGQAEQGQAEQGQAEQGQAEQGQAEQRQAPRPAPLRVEAHADVPHPSEKSKQPRRYWSTRADFAAGTGRVPGLSLTAGLGTSFNSGAKRPALPRRFELWARYTLPGEAPSASGADPLANISLWSADGRSCWEFEPASRLRLPLCIGVEGGVLRANPTQARRTDVATPLEARAIGWFSLGFTPGLELQLSQRVALALAIPMGWVVAVGATEGFRWVDDQGKIHSLYRPQGQAHLAGSVGLAYRLPSQKNSTRR